MRNTRHRNEAVYEAISAAPKAVCGVELVEAFSERFTRATVYRAIAALLEEQRIKLVNVGRVRTECGREPSLKYYRPTDYQFKNPAHEAWPELKVSEIPVQSNRVYQMRDQTCYAEEGGMDETLDHRILL